MKISSNFIKREIFGDVFLVPIGEASKKINGLVSLNEVCAFIYDCFTEECMSEDVVKKVTEHYDVDESTARKDIEECVKGFVENGIII